MGGVGCDPGPAGEGLDLGGAVGGAVGFLRSNVIENEGLHSTLKGTVGTVGAGASGAWSTIRRSLQEGELVGQIAHHTTAEDGALVKGLGWTVGAVGGLLEKASQGLGDFVNDGDQGQAAAPRCPQGHPLMTDFGPEAN